MLASASQNNLSFSFLLTSGYFLLSLIGILHHEIWLDEAHSFLIARDSYCLYDLIANTRQEGHPLLWYFILWLLTGITHDTFYMQLLHILISTFNIFLLLRFAPFGKFKKFLFAFSYFFFYEYNIISRNYSLCILWVTIFCILLCKERKNYILLAIILALLANSHFIAMILSFPMGIATLIVFLNDKNQTQQKGIAITATLIFIAGYIICIMQVIPPEGSLFTKLEKSEYLSIKRLSSFTVFFKSFYQFPDLTANNLWNSNLFTSNKFIGVFLTILFPLVVIKSFLDKPLSLLIIFISALGITLFFYAEMMQNYTVRHWGFIFLGFYAGVWTAEGLKQEFILIRIKKIKIITNNIYSNNTWREGLVYSALCTQMLASAFLFALDFKKPFSNSKLVADYIRHNNYKNELIIVSNSTTGPAISAYLEKKIYYPECRRMGSFSLWNSYPILLSEEEILNEISSFKQKGYKRAILVLYKNIFDPLKNKANHVVFEKNGMKIKYLISFKDGIVKHENFDLFLISY